MRTAALTATLVFAGIVTLSAAQDHSFSEISQKFFEDRQVEQTPAKPSFDVVYNIKT
jgi:hypothetical protein